MIIFDMAQPVAYNGLDNHFGGIALADGDEPVGIDEEQSLDVQQIVKRLDMLDQRLDNIDSIVTAVAERVVSQLVTLNITCPRCGREIEIAVVGTQKPVR